MFTNIDGVIMATRRLRHYEILQSKESKNPVNAMCKKLLKLVQVYYSYSRLN